jgi:hypothetical protein
MYAMAGRIQPEIRTRKVASIQEYRLIFITVEVSAYLLIAVHPKCLVMSGCTAGPRAVRGSFPHSQLSTFQGPSATFEVSWQAFFQKWSCLFGPLKQH